MSAGDWVVLIYAAIIVMVLTPMLIGLGGLWWQSVKAALEEWKR